MSATVMRRRSPPSMSQMTGTRSWYTCARGGNVSGGKRRSYGFLLQMATCPALLVVHLRQGRQVK